MGRKSSKKKGRLDKDNGIVYSKLSNEKYIKEMHKAFMLAKAGKHPNFKNENEMKKTLWAQALIVDSKEKSIDLRLEFIMLISRIEYSYSNIYISDLQLLDFLENNTIKDSDIMMIKTFLQYWFDDTKKSFNFAIHIPNKKRSIHCFYEKNVYWTESKNNFPMFAINRGDGYCLEGAERNDMSILMFKDFNEIKSIIKEKAMFMDWRIVLNLLLYMDAFPEAVKEGPPNIILDNMNKIKMSKTISLSHELQETYRNGITPHMRRGHFRFLKSDRYKNKRFQTVYIKPTMVKGTAEHVVSV